MVWKNNLNMKPLVTLLTLAFLFSCVTSQEGTETSPFKAKQFLKRFDTDYRQAVNKRAKAMWKFNVDTTTENQLAIAEAQLSENRVLKELGVEARKFHLPSMGAEVRRQLKKVLELTASPTLEDAKVIELEAVKAEMKRILNAGMRATKRVSSNNEGALLEFWKSLRDNTGKKYKHLYPRYVELNNEAARLSGYVDYGDQWRWNYGQSNFTDEVFRLYNDIKSIYEVLHTHVKHRLLKIYPKHLFPKSGHIPEHLAGYFSWRWLFERTKPYKYGKLINITEKLIDKGYTVKKMYDDANNFYKSMGLPGMPPSVWNNSLLERPKDGRNMICHPTAWDMQDRTDLRLSMCAQVHQYFMKTMYHEMGHLVYFQQYSKLNIYDMGSPNEAFHEAIGDIMGRSFESPEHMVKKGFIWKKRQQHENTFLYAEALTTLPSLMTCLIVDLFRWGVFSGRIKPEDYNKEWWRLQCKYKGISPPTNRSQDDFDLGVIFHVPADISLIRYYIGMFIEFQFYMRACLAKNYPIHLLYMCDLSGSKVVGNKFRKLMSAGSTRPWQEVLKEFTKYDSRVEAEGMTSYYHTMIVYIGSTMYPEGFKSGWNEECDPYPSVG